MSIKLTRRSFLGFFLIGGLVGMFRKKAAPAAPPKKAMFWRKKHEA